VTSRSPRLLSGWWSTHSAGSGGSTAWSTTPGYFSASRSRDYTRGHIVNITASLGDDANSSSPSALTSLTKGGLAAVTRALATEYASRGVRVNAVAPGVIKTPAYDAASYEGMAGPVGRVGQISDIADAILYLEQATFVTGETLHVDGGQAAGH
jgi:NAD(P)-dependent dehydrogenase (short-subunit alcohol dehydrogenase family)